MPENWQSGEGVNWLHAGLIVSVIFFFISGKITWKSVLQWKFVQHEVFVTLSLLCEKLINSKKSICNLEMRSQNISVRRNQNETFLWKFIFLSKWFAIFKRVILIALSSCFLNIYYYYSCNFHWLVSPSFPPTKYFRSQNCLRGCF